MRQPAFNPGPLDYESNSLTTPPRCLLQVNVQTAALVMLI